ncbi:MAG: DUF2203 domain-containing protein, partial [bacterium]|nr:DUF2203 domain-containing protein [bacterium]
MPEQRVFTVAEARAMLPLVRSIVRDIRECWQQIPIPPLPEHPKSSAANLPTISPEEQKRVSALEAKLIDYVNELQELGISIKSVES